MDFSYCNAVDPNTNIPIDWQLRYSWLLENQRSRASTEHYVVNWSIENLGLLPEDEYKCILSPSFCLDSSRTVWRFKLFPGLFRNGQKLAFFNVQRLKDRGPSSVDITYRFGVVNACNKIIWFEQRKKTSFEVGNVDGLHIQTFEHIHSVPDGVLVVDDVLKVVCEMYISYPVFEYIDNLLSVADYDLINLSSDLMKLMRSKESCDYCIKIGHYEVIVHKAILGARSPVFKNILKDDKYRTRYELPSASFSNITNLLLFMYSGNFNLVSKNGPPDIGFYECAVEYSIPELASLLSPNYLNFRSKLQSEEIEFTWHIQDLSKRFTSDFNCIRSPTFKCAYGQSPEWTLIIHSRKVKCNNVFDIDIYIESSIEIDVLHSVLKTSVLDDEDKPHFTRTTSEPYRKDCKFGFLNFVKNLSIQNSKSCYIFRDTLTVHCQWTFVVSRDIFEERALIQRQNIATISSYYQLSQDMKKLFRSGEFSDVAIKSNNSILRAHRSVLFSRSRTLASRFLKPNASRNSTIETIEISDVDPAIVSIMVSHAYSGVFQKVRSETLFKLLSAADKYGFSSLSLMCVQLLGPKLNVGNFFELLSFGKRINNVSLVGKCLTFAKMNAEAILADSECEEWRRREQETYELLAEWIPIFALR